MKKKTKNYFLAILIVFIVALVYLWEQIESERWLRKLNEIDKIREQELEKHTQLQIKYTTLRSPERLNAIAKKAKFVIPDKNKIIYIE
ncbi:MAG: hypothetical protein QME68_00520 [Elusimicrobiota bacterium]|nr:hypothetical protein [Elusimicrobiota bacterium]